MESALPEQEDLKLIINAWPARLHPKVTGPDGPGGVDLQHRCVGQGGKRSQLRFRSQSSQPDPSKPLLRS